MPVIFISHSSVDNAPAIALRDWLVAEGWNDLFLDLDPERGIAAGERWERALNEAARRCESVIFLISKAWLNSPWCKNELNLARRLNKRLFGMLIEEGLSIRDLPSDVTNTWQLVNLATGRDHAQYRVLLPITGEEVHVTYSREGLARLKTGLTRAGLSASYFNWPPDTDPKRAPYRGLRPLEADDAGIFFGREAPVIEAIDKLRGLREAAPPRCVVILGASGGGKSSFLRAGLLPRLGRDDQTFCPLPVVRPERAAIAGETGLLRSLEDGFESAGLKIPRADLRAAIEGGATKLKPLLRSLIDKMTPIPLDGETNAKPPILVIAIDQGEELFLAEAQAEARPLLALLRDLLLTDAPAAIAVFAIRSDNYERMQEARELEGIAKLPFDLGPIPKGSYAEVIKGPVRRLEDTERSIKIDDALVDALLADIEAGGAKDALPLLAFTLERLYTEYHAGGNLKLEHYNALGRVQGSIEAAVERAFNAANSDPKIPRDRDARLAILRRGLIPWLAGIDPDTGAPRRRVARFSEIPAEARPLIDHLVEQRLLSIDIAENTGETTIEPTHEALLRQWGLLQGWLKEDAGLLTVLDGIKRASRDWAANNKAQSWLSHSAERLQVANRLTERPDLSANLEPTDKEYLDACRAAEKAARARFRKLEINFYVAGWLLLLIIAGWFFQRPLREQYHWHLKMTPSVLTAKQESMLAPKDEFRECVHGCPTLVVVPAGSFAMGSPESEEEHRSNEGPQHKVTLANPFAVGKFDVTFAEWDACVDAGACPRASDSGWGRADRPVIYVSWEEAKLYVAWLSRATGKDYRLLSEAEWEYAARAGSTTRHFFGDDEADQYAWHSGNSGGKTQPVGKKKPNAFGLYDMHGNVWQWVEDAYHDSYEGAPKDGSAWIEGGEPGRRVIRGASWVNDSFNLRAALRERGAAGSRFDNLGFRLGRTLTP
jgi:formylglycine-generating enzyme required for sulfatase activity